MIKHPRPSAQTGRAWLVMPVMAVALLLAACGDDDKKPRLPTPTVLKTLVAEVEVSAVNTPSLASTALCHSTGSIQRPYELITAEGETLLDHYDHPDDIIPAPLAGCPGPGTPVPSRTARPTIADNSRNGSTPNATANPSGKATSTLTGSKPNTPGTSGNSHTPSGPRYPSDSTSTGGSPGPATALPVPNTPVRSPGTPAPAPTSQPPPPTVPTQAAQPTGTSQPVPATNTPQMPAPATSTSLPAHTPTARPNPTNTTPPAPPPTSTALPTNTAVPTNTPIPAATSTPPPTATAPPTNTAIPAATSAATSAPPTPTLGSGQSQPTDTPSLREPTTTPAQR
ncbi:MAG: hypothetical protein WCD37_16805 [Chloroflexia bacterium]